MQIGYFPHLHVVDKHHEGYMGYEGPPLKREVFKTYTRVQAQGCSASKKQQGLWLSKTKDFWSPR